MKTPDTTKAASSVPNSRNFTNNDTNLIAPLDRVLAKLDKVRRRQSGQWSACCPAHSDRGPSLSIRETPGGAVLLHCFAGCTVEAVVASIGIDLPDLYPPRTPSGREPNRIPRLLTDRQALELLENEASQIVIALANFANGIALSEADLTRTFTAAGRISWLRSECMGGDHAHR